MTDSMSEKLAKIIYETDDRVGFWAEWEELDPSDPTRAAHVRRADAVIDALMDVSADHEAMIAGAIAAEFDLVLADMKNSEFMDFIAAAKAARLALIMPLPNPPSVKTMLPDCRPILP